MAELVGAAELYLKGWRPRGRRLVAISNSGAVCVMAADAASAAGMPMAAAVGRDPGRAAGHPAGLRHHHQPGRHHRGAADQQQPVRRDPARHRPRSRRRCLPGRHPGRRRRLRRRSLRPRLRGLRRAHRQAAGGGRAAGKRRRPVQGAGPGGVPDRKRGDPRARPSSWRMRSCATPPARGRRGYAALVAARHRRRSHARRGRQPAAAGRRTACRWSSHATCRAEADALAAFDALGGAPVVLKGCSPTSRTSPSSAWSRSGLRRSRGRRARLSRDRRTPQRPPASSCRR